MDTGGGSENASAGQLVFRRPLSNLGDLILGDLEAVEPWWQSRDLVLDAQNGTLVLFPSALQHWVTPHRSIGPRISVAFNAEIISADSAPCHSNSNDVGLLLSPAELDALVWPHPGSLDLNLSLTRVASPR